MSDRFAPDIGKPRRAGHLCRRLQGPHTVPVTDRQQPAAEAPRIEVEVAVADLTEEQTSNGSSIASTMQQLSISVGVAVAGLTTVFFIPAEFHSNPQEMIRGIHEAFLVLGGLTILSTIVFCGLKSGDGDKVSQQREFHPGG